VSAFGESQQTVVGQWLPTGRVCDELSNGRADSRVIVERSHADADRFGVTGIRPVDRRSAFSAEPLFSTVGRLPHPQRFLTGDDPERSRSGMCLRRGRSTTSPLTSFAVAVARPHQRRRDLVADSAAITPTGERKPHGPAGSHRTRRQLNCTLAGTAGSRPPLPARSGCEGSSRRSASKPRAARTFRARRHTRRSAQ
jgi:hypothetical protein